MSSISYPAHTPELARLLDAMNTANAALVKAAKRNRLAAFGSLEYKASRLAYRAYWAAVDADRGASKVIG